MAKPMTKTQLVAALAEEMGSDKKSAGGALDHHPRSGGGRGGHASGRGQVLLP
jgi:hypothetical protein